MGFLKRELKKKYDCKFEDEDLKEGLNNLISQAINIDKLKISKKVAKKKIQVTKIDSPAESLLASPAIDDNHQ